MISPKDQPEVFLAMLAGLGAAIGLGKLLGSDEKLTLRLAVGRALTNAGIGAAAGATTLLFPSADPLVMYGVAAGLASLGTSALEVILKKRIGGAGE
jgi:hypothetical protein